MGLTSRRGSIIIEHPSRGVASSVAGKLQLGLLFLRDTIEQYRRDQSNARRDHGPPAKRRIPSAH